MRTREQGTDVYYMKHNTPYRVTKGNTDGGIVAGDIVSYDSSGLVMWDGKYTGMYDNKDLADPQISDFECEVAEDYRLFKNQERISCRKITGNRVAEVAGMYGKKLGEEFRVVSDNCLDGVCRFDENNILEVKDMQNRWVQDYVILGELLKGTVEIAEGENGRE